MKNWQKLAFGAVMVGSLVSCGDLAKILGTGNCTSYSDESADGFQMSIDTAEIIMKPIGVAVIPLKQSWITVDYSKESKPAVREDITCRPNWTYSKIGVVEVDKDDTLKLNALGVGLSQVTANAQGNTSIKDSFWALVNPLVTETSTPNDTFALAIPVTSSVIGSITGSDLDFWKFTIPATKTYRVTLTNAVDISPASQQFFSSYSADFYNGTQQTVSTPTTNKLEGQNTTTGNIDVYVRVTGNSNSDTPYELKLELF